MSTSLTRQGQKPDPAACLHCGQPSPPGGRFCCAGCDAAYHLIQQLGLGRYYLQRALDPAQRPIQPDPQPRTDLAMHCATDAQGTHTLLLALDGLRNFDG